MSGKEVQKVLTIGKTSLQKSLSLSMTSLMDSGDEMVSTDDGSTESEVWNDVNQKVIHKHTINGYC